MNPQKPISILEAVVATVVGLICAGVLLLADVPLLLLLVLETLLQVLFGEFPVDPYLVYPTICYLWFLLGVCLALVVVVVDGGRFSGSAGLKPAKNYWLRCWQQAGWFTKGAAIAVLAMIGVCFVWPNYKGCQLAVYSRAGAKVVYARDGSVEPEYDRTIDINFASVKLKDRHLLSMKGNLSTSEPFRLDLSRTEISDQGLDAIADNSSLLALDLYNTNVTDAGIAKLAGCSSLLLLNLSGTQATDDSLDTVVGLPKLRELRLSNTRISEQGVERLQEMPSLRLVELWTPRVSEQSIAQLQAALPGIEVQRCSYVSGEMPPMKEARGKSRSKSALLLVIALFVAMLGLGPFYLAYRDSLTNDGTGGGSN